MKSSSTPSSSESTPSSSVCGSPSCGKPGKFICSACGSISYCSQACQKSHWSNHKIQCKSISQLKKSAFNGLSSENGNSSTGEATPAIVPSTQVDYSQKLQIIKAELQKAYQSNDLKSIIKLGKDALIVAKLMPEPASTVELIQLHLNISNALMQSNQFKDAEVHTNLCLEYAEKGLILRPQHPQAMELQSVALVNKAYWLINNSNIAEAEEVATKARILAGQIYPPKEPRNFKTLRCLGIIREKQDKLSEAEEFFKQGYDLVSGLNIGSNAETHMIVDDLIQMFLKHNNVEQAEKYARMYYTMITENLKGVDNPSALVVGDVGAKLASVLCRCGKNVEAEGLMRDCLAIRSKYLGQQSTPVAMTLVAIAGIAETLKKSRDEIEGLLTRAYEIFIKVEGPNSPQAMATAEHLRKLRLGQSITAIDPDGDIRITNESSIRRGSPSSSSSMSPTAPSESVIANADDDDDLPSFHPSDGNGRMRQAAIFFEQGKYAQAEILLSEACEIFIKQVGPDSQVSKDAKQNLGVVRHNLLIKLWKQVVKEALDADKASSSSNTTASSGESMRADDDGALDEEKPWYVKEQDTSVQCVLS